MILDRYIMSQVVKGTLLALLVLVSLAVFFTFIGELEDLGRGNYNLVEISIYVLLGLPGKLVEFMPLAILLGTILSLGALASNSEIIAIQSSGVSVFRLLKSILLAAILLAVASYLISDWVVPLSETQASQVRSNAINAKKALKSKKGIWIKDENRIVHINQLMPGGIGRDIEIFELDKLGRVVSIASAGSAIPEDDYWILQDVKKTIIGSNTVNIETKEKVIYEGDISNDLLGALMIKPRQMSTTDLYSYLSFLATNELDNSVESLTFWQKVFSPLTVIVMCLLAVPFVLGSQRQSNTGQRLMMGIVLGLCFVVCDRLLTQFGIQIGLFPVVNAFLSIFLFFILSIFLLNKKLTHGIGKA